MVYAAVGGRRGVVEISQGYRETRTSEGNRLEQQKNRSDENCAYDTDPTVLFTLPYSPGDSSSRLNKV